MTVQVNSLAPAFELPGGVGKRFRKVKLSDDKGKWVVLLFLPAGLHPPSETRRSSSSPGGNDGHRISLVPEMEFHQASDIPVVFDHQDIAGHPGDSRQPAAIFRTAATTSAGSIRTV